MYSRVTLLEIDTLRTDVDEAVEQFETRSCRTLRELPGYEGVVVLVTPEGKGMVVTLLGQRGGRRGERRLRRQRASRSS